MAATGMFEANAIQFGMDQMLEASSDQLWSIYSVGKISTGASLVVVVLGTLEHEGT